MNRTIPSFVTLCLLPLLACCQTGSLDASATPTGLATAATESTNTPAHASILTPTRAPASISTPTPASTSTPTPARSSEPTPTPIEAPTVAATPESTTHTVRAGDTLLGLAKRYGVPIAAIQLENGMGESTVLHVGEVLTIPPESDWEGGSLFWIVYVVKSGDTLAAIAGAYGLGVEEIQAVNHLTDAGRIHAGQELVLPLDAPVSTPAPTSTATPTPQRASTPTSTAQPTVAPPPPTAVPPDPPPSNVGAWPHEVARLINEVRAQHGLEPFMYNETLARAAQAHANDCSRRGWCSHTGSDGSDVKTRIIRAGYDATGWAECWVQRPTPQSAVDWWMDEVPPNDWHRRTLLSTWVTEVGVGIAEADWGYYFVADFGRP